MVSWLSMLVTQLVCVLDNLYQDTSRGPTNNKFLQSFTQTLYNLSANPQYIQALRDGVEPIIKEEG